MTMDSLYLIPTLPLLGFLLLLVTEGKLPKVAVAVIGAGSIGAAAIVTLMVGLDFAASSQAPYSQTLWTWMQIGEFAPRITLLLDGLSLVMIGVITGVGFLIHLYATGYMAGEAGYSRFFAYMNLFVFAMLILVLGDNLLVLYFGWEGVGLCSYLLIGFFHDDPDNGYAARKAFVVTRVGDVALAFGLFFIYQELGTLEIAQVLDGARAAWPDGSAVCTLIALLLLGGAVGKSAQLPLQTWLPDAMAGPTPVSALIHAATMVTAGVYLIARMHDLYLLAPTAQLAVAIVGAATLFIAGASALAQNDIKRILAYSTMSQIGYMFMALGVGAWSGAIFHLMTHAFFKALLFLSAGSVILALHHEQDIFKMGGLWKRLPIPFACMVIGSAALAALPLTSGYYSKDAILLASFGHVPGGHWFWGIGAAAAFLTALYTVRMIVVAFFGDAKMEAHDHSGINMSGPLLVLAVLSLFGGLIGLAPLALVLPNGAGEAHHDGVLAVVTGAVPIVGLAVGWLLFVQLDFWRSLADAPFGRSIRSFLHQGWGFDVIYDALIVKPFVALARINKNDIVDLLFTGIAALSRLVHRGLAVTQNGRVRWYAANMAAGVVLIVLVVLGVL
jgi:NADH-quinone oxidoreductase subunit L